MFKSSNNQIEQSWASLRKALYDAALETIGTTKRKHQDWFDENDDAIAELIDRKKNRAHQALLSSRTACNRAAFCKLQKEVQQRLRQMQNEWLLHKASEIQSFADKKDMKNFYDSVQKLYGPQPNSSAPVYQTDGETLLTTNQEIILYRCAEHFESVLNRSSEINDEAINRLPQVPLNEDLDSIQNPTGGAESHCSTLKWQSPRK